MLGNSNPGASFNVGPCFRHRDVSNRLLRLTHSHLSGTTSIGWYKRVRHTTVIARYTVRHLLCAARGSLMEVRWAYAVSVSGSVLHPPVIPHCGRGTSYCHHTQAYWHLPRLHAASKFLQMHTSMLLHPGPCSILRLTSCEMQSSNSLLD